MSERRRQWGRARREVFSLRAPDGSRFLGTVAPEDILVQRDFEEPVPSTNGPSVITGDEKAFDVNITGTERECLQMQIFIEDADGGANPEFLPIDIAISHEPIGGVAGGKIVQYTDDQNFGIQYAGMNASDAVGGFYLGVIRDNGGYQTTPIQTATFDSSDADSANHFMAIVLPQALASSVSVGRYVDVIFGVNDYAVKANVVAFNGADADGTGGAGDPIRTVNTP